jgi:uncharacterized protein (TIGR02271 family)
MKTVIGLFDQRDEAKRAYAALLSEGYARADLDILTNDDQDDEPKLARMHSWIPEPDCSVYLAGVREGGTLITANVADSAVPRAASILGSFNMVNVSRRADDLTRKAQSFRPSATGATAGAAATASRAASDIGGAAKSAANTLTGRTTEPVRQKPALPVPSAASDATSQKQYGLTSPVGNDNVLEVIEEDMEVGKEQVERGRMRIYNVVTEREVAQNVPLRDETLRVQRRPVNRAVNVDPEIFKPRSFEMVEMDEVAKVKKTAHVVEEVTLGKDVVDKIETIKQTLRRQDVQVEEVPAARPFESYQDQFKGFYDKNLVASGVSYENVLPSFKFGHSLAMREPFRSSPWSAVEVDAHRIWDERNPGTWDQNKGLVKYAWETVRSAR